MAGAALYPAPPSRGARRFRLRRGGSRAARFDGMGRQPGDRPFGWRGGSFPNDPYGIFAPWRDGNIAQTTTGVLPTPPPGRRPGSGTGVFPENPADEMFHVEQSRAPARIRPHLRGGDGAGPGYIPGAARVRPRGEGRRTNRGLNGVVKGVSKRWKTAPYLQDKAVNLSDFVEIRKSAYAAFTERKGTHECVRSAPRRFTYG